MKWGPMGVIGDADEVVEKLRAERGEGGGEVTSEAGREKMTRAGLYVLWTGAVGWVAAARSY